MFNLTSFSPYERLRHELIATPRVWLVTGAAGFIGSNLVEELLSLGQTVVGLDDLSTGHWRNLEEATRHIVDASLRFRFIRGDVRDLGACREACDGVDFVLHQAAIASVPRSIHDPLTTTSVNVNGFVNALVAARDAGVRRLVFASSRAVYGDANELPQIEERVGRVASPYAATKAANESYAAVFQRNYGLETVGLRYFNVFGRRQDARSVNAAVIPRWIAALIDDQTCEIYGDGETTRDFCFVANVVQANLLAAASAPASATGVAYNVACGRETSLNELFRMVRLGLAGYQPRVATARPRYTPPRAGDVRASLADISRARRHLGYEPSYMIEQGLGLAIEWYVNGEAADALVGSGFAPNVLSTG